EGEAQRRKGRVGPELKEEVPVRGGEGARRREVQGDAPPLHLRETHGRRGEVGAREKAAVEGIQRVAEEDPIADVRSAPDKCGHEQDEQQPERLGLKERLQAHVQSTKERNPVERDDREDEVQYLIRGQS